jgi:hypothetical protein
MTEPSVRGACLCGAVGYEADGPFPVFQYCHCSRCRRFTGSAYASNLFCPPAQFRWTRGADSVQRFALPEARFFATAFCKTCGSSLPWTNQTGTMVIIPAGTLDGAPPIAPSRNIMWASRAPWYVSAAELETHDERPPPAKPK